MDSKKRAIVMGATSGIGKEVAIILAQNGYEVGIADAERICLSTPCTPPKAS